MSVAALPEDVQDEETRGEGVPEDPAGISSEGECSSVCYIEYVTQVKEFQKTLQEYHQKVSAARFVTSNIWEDLLLIVNPTGVGLYHNTSLT